MTKIRRYPLRSTVALFAVAVLSVSAHAETTASATHKVKVETFASGLEYPWGMAFLPNGKLLVSEREGRLRIIDKTGKVSPRLKGVRHVTARGQGGLLGLAISPNFANDRAIFYCHSERRSDGGLATSVSRARLATNERRIEGAKVIFRQFPSKRTARHFGCRLVFDRTGALFITMGDRGNRPEAQNADNNIGTIARIKPNGEPARAIPLNGDWLAKTWSIGHRNIQGAALDLETGELWTVEHGARGGDEINQPLEGKNYGWPTISYGRHYSGGKIGVGTKKAGMEQPVYYWDPSIAPSGLAIYSGSKFPNWAGNIFVGALKDRHLSRLVRNGRKIVHEEKLLLELGERIRAVTEGPDGYLYLLTDNDNGRVLRLTPAQ